MSGLAAIKKLTSELKSFDKDPLEGVTVSIVGDNLFLWDIGIFGPPDTVFTGGYFKARMEFAENYPFSPPKMKFVTEMWHPNVYPSGDLCISILHPPEPDEMSGERPEERWNPTQSVRTILLSVISLMNEPNTSSPANVDASVSFRRWKEGKDDDYFRRVSTIVGRSKILAQEEGVVVPTTIEEYVIKREPVPQEPSWTMDDTYTSSEGEADYSEEEYQEDSEGGSPVESMDEEEEEADE